MMSAHRASDGSDPDFYPTPIWAARAGAELVKLFDPKARTCWEPACGAGHMVHALRDYFDHVWASDAYPYDGNAVLDFVAAGVGLPDADWIVTNPPFILAEEFIRLAYARARRGVAMLLRAAAMETVARFNLMSPGGDCPLTVFAPFAERVPMHKGRWEPDGTTAAFYAWLIWLKPALRPQRFMARLFDDHHPAVHWIAPGAEARLTKPRDAELFGALDRARGMG